MTVAFLQGYQHVPAWFERDEEAGTDTGIGRRRYCRHLQNDASRRVEASAAGQAFLKDLRKRFAFLGEATSSIMFLFGVGEEMSQTLQKMQEMHGSTH